MKFALAILIIGAFVAWVIDEIGPEVVFGMAIWFGLLGLVWWAFSVVFA